MDQQKEKALLGWLTCLIDVGEVDSLKSVDYGSCFIHILGFMDSTISLEDFTTMKEKVLATKKFLEGFYSTDFSGEELINFSILSEPEAGAASEVEVAKVLLLLLCAGIQDKNTDILTAAMRVDAAMHWDVRQLIEAVIQPDEPTTSLPSDFAKVFLECSVNVSTASSSRPISAVTSARLASLSDVQDSPLRLRLASLNLSNLNDSLQTASPARTDTCCSPATPLEELVNSPQLARKIMRREKEYRLKLERQLKEREENLKKCQHDLRTEVHLRDELELDLQESQVQLGRKDNRIQELEQQVQRMRALQDRLDELGAVQDSNIELERDVESLRCAAQTAEIMKQYNQSLREENKGLYDDIANLQEQLSSLESKQCEATKVHLKSEKLKVQVGELEAQLEAMREAHNKVVEEKRVLETDMGFLREVNDQQRQRLLNRSGSVGDVSGSGGESMGVVTDKLMEELRVELDLMRNTWFSPEVHAATVRDLDSSNAAVKRLEEECADLRQKLQQLREDMTGIETQIADRDMQCEKLKGEVAFQEDKCRQLQNTLDDMHNQQSTLQAELEDLHGKFESKNNEYKDLQSTLEQSQKHCDQLQTSLDDFQNRCENLTSNLDTTQEQLELTRSTLQEKTEQCQQLEFELGSKTSQCEQLVSEKSQAVEESTSIKDKLERAVAHEQELEEIIQGKNSEYAKLNREKEQCDVEVRALKKELTSKSANNELLKKVLDTKGTEYSELHTELASKVSELEQLTASVAEKESALAKLQTALEDKDHQCQSLEVRVTEQSKEISEISHRCEELEHSLKEQTQRAETLMTDLIGSQQSHRQAEEEVLKVKSAFEERLSQQTDEVADEMEHKEQKITALQCQLQEKDIEISQLNEDLSSKSATLLGLQESEQCLQDKISELKSLNQQQQEQIAAKQADFEKLQETFNSMETDLAEVKGVLKDSTLFADQLVSERNEAQTALKELGETTLTQLKEAKGQSEAELESLKSRHKHMQIELEKKVNQLEAEMQQKTVHINAQCEQLTKTQQAMESKQASHAEKVDQLREELTSKSEELQQEKQKQLSSEQQLHQLEVSLHTMEEMLKTVQGDHVNNEKSLLDSLRSIQTSAADRETELQDMINTHQEKISDLGLKVKTLEADVEQKETALQQMERQHKIELKTLQQSASEKEESLKTSLDSQKQNILELTQKFEHQETVLSQKDRTMQELETQNRCKLDAVQQSADENDKQLRETIKAHEQQTGVLIQTLESRESELNEMKQTIQALREQKQLEAEQHLILQKSTTGKDLVLQDSGALEIEDLSRKTEKLQNEIASKDSQIQQLQSDWASHIQTSQKQSDDFAKQEQELLATITSLRHENSEKEFHLSKQLEELCSEVETLRSSVAEKDIIITKYETELSEAREAAHAEVNSLLSAEEKSGVSKQEMETSKQSTVIQETCSIKETEVCSVVEQLMSVAEQSADTALIEQLLSRLSELESSSSSASSFMQLAQSLGKLLVETRKLEHAAVKKEQELVTQIREAEMQISQLQGTVTRLSEESQVLQTSTCSKEQELNKLSEKQSVAVKEFENYKANMEIRQKESDRRIQSLQSQLKAAKSRKLEAEAHADDTEEYWKLQLKNLQDEMEADMKQQRLSFENELAEQRAEYETRLSSMLDEQEGLRLGQKAILEDKLGSLQEALTLKQTEFSRLLAEKEALFRENLSTQEVNTEKKLANLQQYLQQEAESQQAIRNQMNEDRAKIKYLETQMAERCKEFEELLHTEQQEKEEIVKRVVEESEEKTLTLQQSLERERAKSLHQIQELQKETKEMKEQLSVSMRRTEKLRHQLSELQSQKDETVCKLEREVERQISILKRSEEENGKLKAKVVDLEETMALRKSELNSLRTSLDQQTSSRGGPFSRKQTQEDKIRSLSGQVDLLKVECQTLQAENKDIQVKATQTTKSMAEQLKRYERKCQQNETQRTLMEERLQAYMEREEKWQVEAEKVKELSQRVQELEAKTAMTEASTSPDRRISTRTSNQKTKRRQSSASSQLDSSFTNTLPDSPGAAEKQILQAMDQNSSGAGRVSGRHSMYSVGSGKSVVFVPTGAGRLFSCEDEPESPKFEWGRLDELQRRNTLCLPHMKSSYPVETQTVQDRRFDEDGLQLGRCSSTEGKLTSSSSGSETSLSRKRKPETMNVEEDHTMHVGQSEPQSRKLARQGPVYQKPGPPTPFHDHHAKQSAQLKDRRQSVTPRRSPRMRTSLYGSAAENETLAPPQDSVAFDVGFSPVKSSSRRITRLHNAFMSKAKSFHKSKSDEPSKKSSASSSAATESERGRSSRTPHTSEKSKGKRKPLSVRNSLQTNL